MAISSKKPGDERIRHARIEDSVASRPVSPPSTSGEAIERGRLRAKWRGSAGRAPGRSASSSRARVPRHADTVRIDEVAEPWVVASFEASSASGRTRRRPALLRSVVKSREVTAVRVLVLRTWPREARDRQVVSICRCWRPPHGSSEKHQRECAHGATGNADGLQDAGSHLLTPLSFRRGIPTYVSTDRVWRWPECARRPCAQPNASVRVGESTTVVGAGLPESYTHARNTPEG